MAKHKSHGFSMISFRRRKRYPNHLESGDIHEFLGGYWIYPIKHRYKYEPANVTFYVQKKNGFLNGIVYHVPTRSFIVAIA
jgi:hypothetical protein